MNWSEISNWTEYSKLLIGLFAITAPLSAVPVFLGLTGNSENSMKKRVALVSVMTYAVALLVFTFFGKQILDIFGISLAAFRIAGGILLLLTALDMMRSGDEIEATESGEGAEIKSAASVGIAPLGIPFLSGPGAMSTIIIYASAHDEWEHLVLVSLVILTVALAIYLLFYFATLLGPFLNQSSAMVMNRVMGLIVAAIAIEFIMHGIADHFPDLTILH